MQNLFQQLSSLGIKTMPVMLLHKSPSDASAQISSQKFSVSSLFLDPFSLYVFLCVCACVVHISHTHAYTHFYILHIHIGVLNSVHHLVKTVRAWSTPQFKCDRLL
ncbi:hypothetical protein AMTRI_Chr03g54760 [Amborella trichopoda]